jgi:hypothetical protein
MKKLLLLLPFLGLSFNNLTAQLDTTLNQEFRASFVGTTYSPAVFDDRLNSYGQWTNLSLGYLCRYKNSNHFLKATLSGKTIDTPQILNEEEIGSTLWTTLNLFLGFEKQYQYKHFGAFFGAGIMGGFLDYQADYQFPDEVAVKDFNFLEKRLGLSGQLTLFTNVTDRLYIFSSISFSTYYMNRHVSNPNILEDFRGLDSQMLIDGVGLAYKF